MTTSGAATGAETESAAAGPWDAPGVTVTALEQVPGWFARPDVPGPVPAVVLVHPSGAWDRRARITAEDAGTDHDVYLFDDLAGSLLRAGVAVVGFDCRFLTDRRGPGWEPGRVTVPGLVQDVAALLGFLRTHPGVDGTRISLLGVSLGTVIAAGAAAHEQQQAHAQPQAQAQQQPEQEQEPCRLILAAPCAVSLEQHLSWTLVGRRLEWLLAAGLVDRDAAVDLGRVAALAAERSGWWEDYDAAHFAVTGPASSSLSVPYEQVAATLLRRHGEYVRALFSDGTEDGPAEYWRSWRDWPPLTEVLAGLRGRVRVHVGDEDWTSAPRQSWLLAQCAPKDLDVQVTVHPDLGHLLSPRDASGRLTYGPIHPSALAALTASALEP